MTKSNQIQGKMKVKRKKKAKGAPKRPLSAYNIFFQKERKRLVLEAVEEESSQASPEQIAEWLKSGRHRPHRKSHGKIGFQDLVKMVSTKWKNLSEDDKKVYKLMAEGEQIRYKEQVQAWKNLEEQRINKEKRAEHEKKCTAVFAKTKEDTLLTFGNHQDARAEITVPIATSSTEIVGSSKSQEAVEENSIIQDLTANLHSIDRSIGLQQSSTQNDPVTQKMHDDLQKLKDMVEQAKSLSTHLVQHIQVTTNLAQHIQTTAPNSIQQDEVRQRLEEASSVVGMNAEWQSLTNLDIDPLVDPAYF